MTELVAGLALGLGAGLSPGPLLALVMTTSLERGFPAGARVAVAPLLTDAPIIVVTVALASGLSASILRGLGLVGGVVVVGMGLRAMRAEPGSSGGPSAPTADVWRGIIVNFASPHPWIFWTAVGAPLLVSAWRESPVLGISFLSGFYGLLIGSKLGVAWAVARGRRRLTDLWRTRLVRFGGGLLVLGGLLIIWEAQSGRI